MAAKKWLDAVTVFRKATMLAPSSSEAAFGLGTSLIQAGRYKEALPGMERLVRERPDNPYARNNIAWLYAKAVDPAVRDVKKAVKYAREAVMIASNEPEIWSTLATAHYASGNYKLALRAAYVALQLSVAGSDTAEHWELVRRCRRAAAGLPAAETGVSP